MCNSNYDNYVGYTNDYGNESYQVRPLPAECENTLATLLSSKVVRDYVEQTLGRGGSGCQADWWPVAVELSKGNRKIDMVFVDAIKKSHQDGTQQAKVFLDELIGMGEITGKMFIHGLNEALLETCADKLSQVPPKGVTETKEPMDTGLENFLNTHLDLKNEIVQALASADGNGQPYWKSVAKMLSVQFPRMNKSFISSIDNYSLPADQAKRLLQKFENLRGSTLRPFVIALFETNVKFKTLCEKIATEAGAPEFLKQLQYPASTKGIPRAVVRILTEELGASRARLLISRKQMQKAQSQTSCKASPT